MDKADLECLREVMRRSDRRWQQTVARWEREAERREQESKRRHDQYMANFREIQAENRAQRAALFKIIDRLDGGAEPAT